MAPIVLSASGASPGSTATYCVQGGTITAFSALPGGALKGSFLANRAQIVASGVALGWYVVTILWTDSNGAARSTSITVQVLA